MVYLGQLLIQSKMTIIKKLFLKNFDTIFIKKEKIIKKIFFFFLLYKNFLKMIP